MVALLDFDSRESPQKFPDLTGHSSSVRGWSEEVSFPSPHLTVPHSLAGLVTSTWSWLPQSSLGVAQRKCPTPALPVEPLKGTQKDLWHPKLIPQQPQTPPLNWQTRKDRNVPYSPYLGKEQRSRQKGPPFFRFLPHHTVSLSG